MEDLLKVTLVANAGIKIEYGGKTLLVDAIYEDDGHPFSRVPRAFQEKIFGQGASDISVDYLLFTHAHLDHFSPEKVKRFLTANRVKGIFYPGTESGPALARFFRERNVPGIELPLKKGRTVYHIEPDISVCVFPTRHIRIQMGAIDGNTVNYCYLLTFGAKKLLITADMDYETETLAWLKGTKLQAVLITPPFFSALQSGKYLKETLHAERYCIYHIPFPEDDQYGMRKTVETAVSKWQGEKGTAIPLLEPAQTVIL